MNPKAFYCLQWRVTYQQPICQTIWKDVWFNKMQKITYCYKAQCHLGQSEDWILCIWLSTHTCNVWRNVLYRICWSIAHQFKHSVDTLIAPIKSWILQVFQMFTDTCTMWTALILLYSLHELFICHIVHHWIRV